MTATSGTWSGAGPITFTYQWRRCDAGGGDCKAVSAGQTRQLGTEDVGHTIRVEVRARNPFGSNSATSAPTGVVPPKGPLPVVSSPPVISGLAREGQVLTAAVGTWGNVTTFSYAWRRCDANGNKCDGFATGPSVKLTAQRRRPPDPRRRRGHEPVRDDEVDLGADRGRHHGGSRRARQGRSSSRPGRPRCR